MAENSGITWCHHTFNPWIGCTKVSPACDHCYAETWDNRFSGNRWGPKAERTRTKDWYSPIKWNRQAQEQGIRFRVFCASLADVFDNKVPPEWRDDLWELIRKTPYLDWLILTKRPQNIQKMLPDDWSDGYPNVWLGISVENQAEADRRVTILANIPAAIRFLSCEPLLGRVDICKYLNIWWNQTQDKWIQERPPLIHWVITGGESGPHYRHANPDWFRSLRDQCAVAGVPFLFKQWEGKSQRKIKALGREPDGVVHDGYPEVKR
jgi:protein gp37